MLAARSFKLAVLCAALLSVNARSLQQAEAPAPGGALSPVDIANFALQLEYLEAQFYSCAATGQPLPSSLLGNGAPAVTGCQKANLTTVGQQLASELMHNEMNHVEVLRAALGSAAVSAPLINIGSSFSEILNAALGNPASPAYSPYDNDIFFLLGAFMFEDVGVTAYEGAIQALANSPYLQTAARIAAVEAYQAGIVRSFLFQANEGKNPNWPYQPTISTVVGDIAKLRAGASNSADDVGILNGTTATLVPVDNQSLVFLRDPTQVLDIVTLGKGATGGGFFPNGLNGGLTSTSLSGVGGSISSGTAPQPTAG
ncbi:hypothetical protein WJX73_006566 [Symbiochloris irregularis]|uniref:Desiccation-related protein PCC13-62 n=1 Tax=Symbiochloris irregularis TaxID=706552 RepID=A0AAW1NMX9_9CHLO